MKKYFCMQNFQLVFYLYSRFIWLNAFSIFFTKPNSSFCNSEGCRFCINLHWWCFFARPNPGISFYLNFRIAINLRQTKIEAGPTRSFYLTNSVVNSNTIIKCYCSTFLRHEIGFRSDEPIRLKNQVIYDLKLTEKLKDKLKFASSKNFASNFLKISSFSITFLWFLNDGRSFHWNG